MFDWQREAQANPCPTCHVDRGEPCQRTRGPATGLLADQPHTARYAPRHEVGGVDITEHVRAVVNAAPVLTVDQRDRLADALSGARTLRAELEAAAQAAELEEEQREVQARQAEAAAAEAAEVARARCAVYRHFDSDGALLYVGLTSSSGRRRGDHLKSARWLRFHDHETVEWLPDREAAERTEAAAIASEQPIFNIRGAAEGSRERRIRYLVEHNAYDLLSDR